MATKPILFSTPMVQAILEGRKSMTRRIISANNSLVDGSGISAKAWDHYQFDFTKVWVDPGPSVAGNPGPTMEDEYDYKEVDGILYAKKKK